MASIRKRGRMYYFTYTDADGRRVERRGCSDHRETEKLAALAEAKVARVSLGLSSPDEETRADALLVPIFDHLEAWTDTVESRGREKTHSDLIRARAEDLLKLAGIKTLRDLRPSKLQAAMEILSEDGLANRTVNHYLRAVRNFLRWLVDEGMYDRDITRKVTLLPENEPTYVRRALTREEGIRLLSVVGFSRRDRYRLSGIERAWVYRLALATGYRADEIRSLTRASFGLERETPSIDLPGSETKNGKAAEQPLPLSTVGPLREWLDGRPKAGPVVRLTRETAKMLRSDLAEAGIPFETDEGRIDFHALRATYATWLVESGADVKTAQTLLRHSDPKLTIGLYAKSRKGSLFQAVQSLNIPSIPAEILLGA